MIFIKSKNKIKNKCKSSESGFVAAEFLFSFVLVISCGIIIFALTFSLMTVEVAQYITWSAARSYSAGNVTKGDSLAAAQKKFANLSVAFPLLSGQSGEWFKLSPGTAGAGASRGFGPGTLDPSNSMGGQKRHPWSGMSSELELTLFKSLKIPFLGPVSDNADDIFKFNLRAFILRNPSQKECQDFFSQKFNFIKSLPDYRGLPSGGTYIPHEDNGC